MVSSNFERLLFDLYKRDAKAIRKLMEVFNNTGKLKLDESALQSVRALFSSHRVDDEQTVATIREEYLVSNYLLDPHSAIGLRAGRQCRSSVAVPMITLATAHPAKFPEAVARAGYPHNPPLPPHMADLFERTERYEVQPNDLAAVQTFIAANLAV